MIPLQLARALVGPIWFSTEGGMNFGGGFGGVGFLFAMLVWALPIILAIWFIRMVASIAAALRAIVVRLDSLERAVRDSSNRRGT